MRRGVCGSILAACAIGLLLPGALPRSAASADEVRPFPDDWFFDGPQRPAPLKALEGKPAAALSIESWIGSEITIAGSRGKVVVVDFWATWCGPCMASIPHNVELVKKYADQGLVFVGVHDSNSGWDSAAKVVQDKGINYPVGVDKTGGPSVKDYAVQFWPTYVAVDRKGVIRAAGLLPNRVEDVVKALLAEAGGPAAPGDGPEFGPEFYYGGDNRPRELKALEGKTAPRVSGREWLGSEVTEAAMKNNVAVITFVSPGLTVSLAELDKLTPVHKEFAPQGVLFLAACDGRAPWEKMQEFAKAKSLSVAVMRDAVEARTGDDGKPADASVTASAFNVLHYPATVILDRSGKVRAAGVRADKIKLILEKLLAETVADAPATP